MATFKIKIFAFRLKLYFWERQEIIMAQVPMMMLMELETEPETESENGN